MPIYTRKGDAGNTQLATGEPTTKLSAHIKYYGMLDELSSHLGLLIAHITVQAIGINTAEQLNAERTALEHAQQLLFNLGVESADEGLKRKYPAPTMADVASLEARIDAITQEMGGTLFRGFVLPGGCIAAAQAHVARTVCRRIERELYTLKQQQPTDHWRMNEGQTMSYVNRLSDFLFAMAKKLNYLTHHAEKSVR